MTEPHPPSEVQAVDSSPRTIVRRAVVNVPAATLFSILADPHRHHEVDGSGTVGPGVKGPHQVGKGDRFTVKMKQFGVPYRMRSTVTEYTQDEVIEWAHPARHRWRWQLQALAPGSTLVTETWDASRTPAFPIFKLMRMVDRNTKGIEQTLAGLQQRYP